MEEVNKRLQALGSWPPATRSADWCQFGDSLAKDIGLHAMTWNNLQLRKDVKAAGGVAAIWRNLFPASEKELVKYYGLPSENKRAQKVYPVTYERYQSQTQAQTVAQQ